MDAHSDMAAAYVAKETAKGDNSQTVITDSDFRSNDNIQNFLQRKMEEHYYRGEHPIKS